MLHGLGHLAYSELEGKIVKIFLWSTKCHTVKEYKYNSKCSSPRGYMDVSGHLRAGTALASGK